MRALLPALLLLPTPSWGQGPIETRNANAASLAFLRLDPRGALLAPGERSLGLRALSANNLRFDDGTREDQETERLGILFRRGVARGEWSVEVPFLYRGGGFQDPFIDAYHRLLGIVNFRHAIPYGRSEETLPGSGAFGTEGGLGDVSGTFSRPLGPQAFWSVGLKLPTGNAGGLLGSGGVDLAFSLYDRWKLGRRFDLYGQLGGVLQGDATRLAHNRSLVDQESLALAYAKNSRDSYTFQWQSESSALVVGNRIVDGPHRQLSLGYARRLGGGSTLQAYFSEDGDFLNFRVPQLVNIAPDFTIGVNLTRRF